MAARRGLPWLAERGIEPIVVGLHQHRHGRLAEYSPFADPRHGGGVGRRYARFLIDTVKPRIDATTARGGARAAVDRRIVDGRTDQPVCLFSAGLAVRTAAVMSPSIWFGGRRLLELRRCRRARPAGAFIWIPAPPKGRETLRNTRTLARLLRRKGYGAGTLRYVEAHGHGHTETDWAWRLPEALEFLLE